MVIAGGDLGPALTKISRSTSVMGGRPAARRPGLVGTVSRGQTSAGKISRVGDYPHTLGRGWRRPTTAGKTFVVENTKKNKKNWDLEPGAKTKADLGDSCRTPRRG